MYMYNAHGNACTWRNNNYFTGFPLKGMMYNMWLIIYRMIYMANSMFQG